MGTARVSKRRDDRPPLPCHTYRHHNDVTPLAYTRGTIRNALSLLRTSVWVAINLDEDVENRYDYAMDEFGNLENRSGTNDSLTSTPPS